MADINEMRKRFYEEDDADPYGPGLGTSSSTAGASSSAGPARRSAGAAAAANAASSSSSASASGGRPGPYPKRPSDGRGAGRRGGSGNGGGGGNGGAHAKRKDLSFIERARAAPDDDDVDYGSNAGLSGAGAMDVDVDVSHPGPGPGRGRLGNDTEASDVAKLVRAWQNERHAPDILPSADALLVRVLDAIRRQVSVRCGLCAFCLCTVYCMLTNPSPPPLVFVSSSLPPSPLAHTTPTMPAVRRRLCAAERGAHVRGGALHDDARPDRGRAHQVRRALLRPHASLQGPSPLSPLLASYHPYSEPSIPILNLQHRRSPYPRPQIEQLAAYITSQPTLHSRLTAAELRHAQRYAALTVSQFTHTVLAHLPDAQQALDDEVITIPNMS